MPRARHKKTTEYQASMTKAIFLFGSPNTGKRALLKKIQLYYTDLVNRDIGILSDQPGLTMELVKNYKKASVVRALEKSIRPAGVNSAFCQNAFDCAFTKLANRLDTIRIDMHAENQTPFTQSKVLYAMSILGRSREEMAAAMDGLAAGVKKKESRNGKQFCCPLCGHTDDADHNASVVLKNRAIDHEFLDACEKYKYDHKGRQAAIRAIGKKRSNAWKKAKIKMIKATA